MLYAFRCREGHLTERLVRNRDEAEIACQCGFPARRESVNAIGFTGFTPTPREQKNYRQEFSEFKEASAEVDYAKTRAEANGQTVKSPSYFREGMKRANKEQS